LPRQVLHQSDCASPAWSALLEMMQVLLPATAAAQVVQVGCPRKSGDHSTKRPRSCSCSTQGCAWAPAPACCLPTAAYWLVLLISSILQLVAAAGRWQAVLSPTLRFPLGCAAELQGGIDVLLPLLVVNNERQLQAEASGTQIVSRPARSNCGVAPFAVCWISACCCCCRVHSNLVL